MTDRPTPDELFDIWFADRLAENVIPNLREAYKAGYTAHMAERHADG